MVAALGKILNIMNCVPLTKGLDECVCNYRCPLRPVQYSFQETHYKGLNDIT